MSKVKKIMVAVDFSEYSNEGGKILSISSGKK